MRMNDMVVRSCKHDIFGVFVDTKYTFIFGILLVKPPWHTIATAHIYNLLTGRGRI